MGVVVPGPVVQTSRERCAASMSELAHRSCLRRGKGCEEAAWLWLCSAISVSGETSLFVSRLQGPSFSPIP